MADKKSNIVEGLRQSYQAEPLTKNNINANPYEQFHQWMQDAINSDILEPNAMTLCTVDPTGFPQGRIVLLKGYGSDGFRFFTNYQSEKGRDIAHNPRATLVFFWDKLQRQVRISGTIQKISEKDSSAYFHKRPVGSQMGAIASPQSSEIEDREVLKENLEKIKTKYEEDNKLEKPVHWGGYIVLMEKIEFWQGQKSRLDDRIQFTRSGSQWLKKRLAP